MGLPRPHPPQGKFQGVDAGMERCLGLRLVRGPDWCCGDQDGGEGSVGTLVEVGEGGRSALVQWDGGTRGLYRCGEDGKFELRVLDAAPTGELLSSVCPHSWLYNYCKVS